MVPLVTAGPKAEGDRTPRLKVKFPKAKINQGTDVLEERTGI